MVVFKVVFVTFARAPFCQDFSWNLGCPKRFDRKLRGEICQIAPLKMPIFSSKIAVKPKVVCKPLKFNKLQNCAKIPYFVKIFYYILPIPLPEAE